MARTRTTDTAVILDAALRRFLHHGLKHTTMQEIARDAGVAVGTLYLYFQDKDALVVGCADRFAASHHEVAQALLAERRPADQKLRRYVLQRQREWLAVGVTAPHAAELADAVLRLRPERTIDYAREFERTVRGLLQEGRAAGVFPGANPDRDARVFTLAATPFFPLAGRDHPALPRSTGLRATVDWFIELWKSGRSRREPGKESR